MPLVRLETTEKLPPDKKAALCAELSKLCAELIGKPEEYMMAIVADGLSILRSGEPGPAAFVDVRSIGGLGPKVNRALAERICGLLERALGIPGGRVYLNMLDVAARDWGHDGTTYG